MSASAQNVAKNEAKQLQAFLSQPPPTLKPSG